MMKVDDNKIVEDDEEFAEVREDDQIPIHSLLKCQDLATGRYSKFLIGRLMKRNEATKLF